MQTDVVNVISVYVCQLQSIPSLPLRFTLTLLLQRFDRWVFGVLVHVAVVKHFVVWRQAAKPQFICRVKKTVSGGGLGYCDVGIVTASRLTLAAPAADLSEHGSLAESVEPLLADQLQQLRLQPLFELAGKEKQSALNQMAHFVFSFFSLVGINPNKKCETLDKFVKPRR